MIQGKELRIGNWIRHDEDKHLKVLAEDIEICSRSPELYSGMSLTEEILKKAGFKKSKKELRPGLITYTYKDLVLRHESTVWRFVYKSVLREIEYLHQLQNLYFALTRKELEINLGDAKDVVLDNVL